MDIDTLMFVSLHQFEIVTLAQNRRRRESCSREL
jgi:hypothetical protein